MNGLGQKLGALALAVSIWGVGCGSEGGPECGNGERDPGEQCDDGNLDDADFCFSDCTTRFIPSLTVKWGFNEDVAPEFTGDSCTDLGVVRVSVTLEGGPEPIVLDDSCSFRQVVFMDLPAGTYTAKVSPLSAGGELLTDAPITREIEFAGGTEEASVAVPPDVWLESESLSGSFFFRLTWGGSDCSSATPPVIQQRITLVARGEVFEGATTDGAQLDGTDLSPCRAQTEQFPHSVLEVPFGEAELVVEGVDAADKMSFSSTFDTFVGAGVNNPELVFDVDLAAGDS